MMKSPVTKEVLDREILAFVENGTDRFDEEKFNDLAIKEFIFQYHENDVYHNLCQLRGIAPEHVFNWWDIPVIPTEAFKQSVIASFPLAETELSLLTSGTTDPDARGKIYRDKGSLEIIKRSNFMLTREFLFPDVDRMRMLLLVPSPKVAPGMPMAYGLEQARVAFGTAESAYYISPRGLAADELTAALTCAESNDEPVCLMGATSGFIFFFNICREKGLKYRLPAGSRVCDGGGYQGTFGACTREQYYALAEDYLGVPEHMCVNTLGMGESGTNYFDNVLRDHYRGEPVQERHKVDLPWTRTVVVGVRTGARMPKGEPGLIRHYDLTNRATVLGVQTDNIGYETDGGFEIIGRSANIPGYNVQTPGGVFKDWLLGAGQHSLLGTGKAHGVPCSTVAEGMIKAQGSPCSTVVDGMIATK